LLAPPHPPISTLSLSPIWFPSTLVTPACFSTGSDATARASTHTTCALDTPLCVVTRASHGSDASAHASTRATRGLDTSARVSSRTTRGPVGERGPLRRPHPRLPPLRTSHSLGPRQTGPVDEHDSLCRSRPRLLSPQVGHSLGSR
jgi:hypothetical protein